MTPNPPSDLPTVPAHHLARVNALLADGRRRLLDEVGYVEVDDTLRTDRLAQRHQGFGHSAQAARDRVAGVDEPNARPIAATRARAQHLFRWE